MLVPAPRELEARALLDPMEPLQPERPEGTDASGAPQSAP
jgi:hypothetical protein